MNGIPGGLGRVLVTRTMADELNGEGFTSAIATQVREAALSASIDESMSKDRPSWDTDVRPPISAMASWLTNCPAKGDVHARLYGRGLSSHSRAASLARFVSYLSWNLHQQRDLVGIELTILCYDTKPFFCSPDVVQLIGGSSVVPKPFCDSFSQFLSTLCGGLQAACGSSKPIDVLVQLLCCD